MAERSVIVQSLSRAETAERFDTAVREQVMPAVIQLMERLAGGVALVSTTALRKEAAAALLDLSRTTDRNKAPDYYAAAAKLAACGILLLMVDRSPGGSKP